MYSENKNTRVRNFLLTRLILSAFSLFILIIPFSCSDDNPAVPKPVQEFDSARFNWRSVSIPNHYFVGMWAQDTGTIFLTNWYAHSLYIESGGNVSTNNFGNYFVNDIKGLSKNEVYLFGVSIIGEMTIIKWNGTTFEYYPTNITVSNADFVKGCAVSSNEIWIISKNGLSKFDGFNMKNYYYDTLLTSGEIFLSKNKLQYLTEWRDISFIRQGLYEFDDTGFVHIYENIISTSNPDYTFLENINGIHYGYKKHYRDPMSICIDNFNGSSFSSCFCFNNKIKREWETGTASKFLVGSNPQEFIYLAATDLLIFQSGVGLITWNGTRPSKEIMLNYFQSEVFHDGFVLYAIDKDNYLLYQPDPQNYSRGDLFIGNRKQ